MMHTYIHTLFLVGVVLHSQFVYVCLVHYCVSTTVNPLVSGQACR